MATKQSRTRGQIIPRGDRKWLVRVYVGVDASGKRKYTSKTVDGTYKMAEQELTKILREIDTNTFVEPSKISVTDFLGEWIRTKKNIAEKTRLGYKDHIDRNVTPFIGRLRLSQVSPRVIRDLYSRLADERGLSPRSIMGVHRVLHAAFEQAVEDGLLLKNPSHRCTDAIGKAEPSAADVLTPEQAAVLLKSTEDDPLGVLWRLLLTSALRPQEALALQWGDVSWEARSITVQRAVVEVAKGKREVSEFTKTDGSKRTIVLSKSTIEALQRHRSRQAVEIMRRGAAYRRNDFIFATNSGQFIDISNVRRAWKKALAAAGLPQRRLYDTRHTHITHLLAAGMNVKAVAQRAGHADPTMTLRVYSHLLPGADAELADAADQLLEKAAVNR